MNRWAVRLPSTFTGRFVVTVKYLNGSAQWGLPAKAAN